MQKYVILTLAGLMYAGNGMAALFLLNQSFLKELFVAAMILGSAIFIMFAIVAFVYETIEDRKEREKP